LSEQFNQLLDILVKDSESIPESRLFELSDLSESRADQVQSIWHNIPSRRRQSLIKILGDDAALHFELNFDRICFFALNDSDPFIRRHSIFNLCENEKSDFLLILLNMLEHDPSPEVRSASASAIGRFIYLGEIGQLSSELLNQAEDALLHANKTDISASVQFSCLESLGYSSRPEIPPLIKSAFFSSDIEFVRSAIDAMGRSANNRWAPEVMKTLHNPHPTLQIEAIKSAGELELHNAETDLLELLDDIDQRVRHAAIWSLAQLGGELAQEALTNLLSSSKNIDEEDLLQDALDMVTFVNGTRDFLLLDFDNPQDKSS
jgi:HEAT repeat protein